jgi:glucose/arabinose dehydrogenase
LNNKKAYKTVLIFISISLIFSFQNTLSVYGRQSVKDPNLKAELVVKGLKNPTSMIFLADHDLLVLEQDGIVRRVLGNTILEQPVLNISSIVNSTRERGLLGIATSDGSVFSQHRNQNPNLSIYLYFTEKIPNDLHRYCNMKNCTKAQVVNSLYVYEMKGGKLVNPKLLFSIPFGNADISLWHIGGKITLGPDGRIYVTGGDGNICENSEECRKSVNEGLLHSKTANSNWSDATGTGGILVTSKDAKTDATKSILGPDHPLNLYYAYGIRNSFGLDFDPLTGDLWDTENGPYYGDEINLVKPGFNSGWAKVQGIWPITNYNLMTINLQPGYHFPQEEIAVNDASLFDFNGNGKYSLPEFTWNKSIGPTALKFFNSDKLGKQYKNDMFVGSYSNGTIYHFELNKERNSIVTDRPLKNNVAYNQGELADLIFAQGFFPITDLQVSPDGFLYFLTYYDGNVWKIVKSTTN